jgi:hypothetical protein
LKSSSVVLDESGFLGRSGEKKSSRLKPFHLGNLFLDESEFSKNIESLLNVSAVAARVVFLINTLRLIFFWFIAYTIISGINLNFYIGFLKPSEIILPGYLSSTGFIMPFLNKLSMVLVHIS